MPKKTRKTTQKELARYQAHCEEWLPVFGLTDWRIDYDTSDIGSNFGRACFDRENRIASFFLTDTVIPEAEISFDVEETAIHELLHLSFSDLNISDRDCETLVRRIAYALAYAEKKGKAGEE